MGSAIALGQSGASVTDATATAKGIVQLTGDFGGTAASPTVPGLAGKEPSITAGTAGQYWRGDKTFVTLDRTAVGLGNVDNTSDVNKPISSATQTALNGKQATLGFTPENAANKGVANGYASLDGSGSIPTSQLPATVLGAMRYKGTFDASTGSYPASPAKGDYYIASVAGTVSGTAYKVGDWATYDGSAWDKIDNSQNITSVNGQTGLVVLTTSNINEGSNLYYTDARVSANSTVVSKAAKGANSDITSLTGLTTPLSIGQGGTGSATQNFVDLTTNQANIAGNKTLTGATTTINGNLVMPTDNTTIGNSLNQMAIRTVNGGMFQFYGAYVDFNNTNFRLINAVLEAGNGVNVYNGKELYSYANSASSGTQTQNSGKHSLGGRYWNTSTTSSRDATMSLQYIMQTASPTAPVGRVALTFNDTESYSNIEAMSFLNTGNVGIGVTNPTSKLHVNGGIAANALRLASSATAGYVLTADANGNYTPQAQTGGGGSTGISSATANGAMYATSATTATSTAALTNGQLLVGSTGNVPVATTLTGSTYIGIANTAGAIAISLQGTIPITMGGTGATTQQAAINATNPHTTVGDLSTSDGTNVVRLAGNITTTKKFLTQTGNGTVSAQPGWNVIAAADVPTLNQNTTGTAANITSIAAIANGGTGASTTQGAINATNPHTTLGDLSYSNGTNVVRLAGNTTTTKQFLTSTGNGTVSAAPTYATIAAADVPTLNQNTTGTAANVTGVVALTNGGTGATTAAGARTALGAAASGANSDITSLTGLTTALSFIQGGNQTNNTYTQSAHGFVVGNVIRRSSGTYVKAIADGSTNGSAGLYMVVAVPDANTFVAVTEGNLVTGLTGLTDATLYYLSPSTAGNLTASIPTANGTVFAPIFLATSATTGYFQNMLTMANGATGTGATVPPGSITEESAGGIFATPRNGYQGALTATSGTLYLLGFTPKANITLSKLGLNTSGTAGSGVTTSRLGIYTYASNGDLTLVASTPNSTTNFTGAYTPYQVGLSASYTLVAGTRYMVGVIIVASTMPSLISLKGSDDYGLNSHYTGVWSRLIGYKAGLTDLPASVTNATISDQSVTAGIYGLV